MTLARFIAAVLFGAALCQAQSSIVVEGVEGKSILLTRDDLSKLPQQTIDTTDHGNSAKFEGVRLADVLAKVELPTGDRYHSTAASYYMVVEAKDGYRTVFAWAELDPSFMDKPVFIVTKRDGRPLSEKEGPFELIAPGERRGGRWVRQLTALKLKQAK
jgi:hypothetical protein